MPRTLTIEPLTRDAFRPFGDVIETAGAEHYPINGGTTTRFHDLASVQLLGGEARALINIFRGRPKAPPLTLTTLERHPLGSQAFVPLQDRPYLVVVAEPADHPNPETVKAFLAQGNQGVNYRAGTWHHYLLALEAESDFLVVDRGGRGDNCEERRLDEAVVVVW